jgi:hypothetical protein
MWASLALVAVFVAGASIVAVWARSGASDLGIATSPGGCDGVETTLTTTRAERERAFTASDAGTKAGELGTLIAMEAPYDAFEPAYVGPVTPFDAAAGQRFGDLAGFEQGYSRTFIARGSYNSGDGFVTVEVYQFETAESAVASLEQHLRSRCGETASTFTIAAVPDAVGISVRGTAPPAEDDVLFVRGQRRYLIRRGLAGPPDNHEQAGELAVAASLLAR